MNRNDLFFEHMSEAAFSVAGGLVTQASAAARFLLPELAPGKALPGYLDITMARGGFSRQGLDYCYHRIDSPDGFLILFWPAAQQALTQRQLEGIVRELRGLLSRMMVSPDRSGGAFQRDFFRMFRLVDHMDFLCRSGQEDGIPFRPITMDLAGLCSRTLKEAVPLLREAGVEAVLEPGCSSLLIPGDPELLKQLFYGLLSNGAKAVQRGGGLLLVRLRAQRGWALLTVSNGDSPEEERLLGLDPDRDVDQPPLPGEGSGMGLDIIRHIARLHGGAALVQPLGGRFVAGVRLPTGPLDSRLSVSGPSIELGGGLPPVLVELADVLPASAYELEDFLE